MLEGDAPDDDSQKASSDYSAGENEHLNALEITQEKADKENVTKAVNLVRRGIHEALLTMQRHVENAPQSVDQRMTIDNLLSGKAGRQWVVKVNSRKNTPGKVKEIN